MSATYRPKRRINGRHFAMVPIEVLISQACRTLPNFAFRLVIAIAAQFRGKNNGNLAMTWAICQPFGIACKQHLVEGLAMLLERGLIQKTRQGGKRPLGPTLYAITWMPINDFGGKIDCGPTTVASNDWATWKLPLSGLPADQRKIEQRDCRQSSFLYLLHYCSPPGQQSEVMHEQRRQQVSQCRGGTHPRGKRFRHGGIRLGHRADLW